MKKETVLAFERKPILDCLYPLLKNDPATQRRAISILYDNNLVQIYREELINILSNYNNIYFLPREIAENDKNYIHIIPYIIIRHKDKFLSYWRNKKAGEQRLHDKMSIGFGGHVNTTSVMHNGETLNINRTITASIKRELLEELRIDVSPLLGLDCISNLKINIGKTHLTKALIKLTANDNFTFLGIIMSNSSEVNSVHLGLVFLLNWYQIDTKSKNNEDGLETFNYYTIDELQQFATCMEAWSQMTLKFLSNAELIHE